MKNASKTKMIGLTVLAMALLFPVSGRSQNLRGDYNYDGVVNVSDLSLMISYLLTDEWNNDGMAMGVRDTVMVNDIPLVMIRVEGGSYVNGSGATVTVGDFSIGRTEVTQELWEAVMGNNPSYHSPRPQRPVEQVSWDDCQEFLATLNEMTGLTFRLPWSVEWEYAARGGRYSHGYRYSGSDIPDLVAWYGQETNIPVQDVALLTCNELGFYDMSGNVVEWCQDANPATPTSRMAAGGSICQSASSCEVTSRKWAGRTVRNRYTGFRLAL